MDPLGLATLDDEGYITLNDNLRLHYELYRPPADPADPHAAAAASGTSSETAKPSPLLMLMGAFATKVRVHFFQTLSSLSATHSLHHTSHTLRTHPPPDLLVSFLFSSVLNTTHTTGSFCRDGPLPGRPLRARGVHL